MDTVCPKCKADITPDDVNVAQNVAYCRACDTLHKLSDLVERESFDDAAAGEIPAGAWLRDDGRQTRVGATMRSVGTAIFFLIFSTFWNSIVAIFVVGAIGSLLGGDSSVSIGEGDNARPIESGDSLFVLLFMIPFVLVGLGTLAVALLALFGRVEVTLRPGQGRVFTGLGPIGWSRRFDSTRVKNVSIETANSSTNGKPDRQVVIDAADRTVKLGTTLSRARRRWIAAALQRLLVA